MSAGAPNSKEQYAAHLPALHLLCNLGWNFLTTAQALAMRGSTREVLLRSRLVAPGDFIVRSGERGTAMYLVASGAVEVRNLGEPILLGTGDFFGELSILAPTRRRKSDIVALTYCRLLVLSRRDFKKLVRLNPELEARIRAAAALQLGHGFRHASPEQVERFARDEAPAGPSLPQGANADAPPVDDVRPSSAA